MREGHLPIVARDGVPLPPERWPELLAAACVGGRDADIGAARRLASARVSSAALYGENHVDVLVDGNATYDAMAEAIDRASDRVHLEIYILADDAVGRRLVERLVRCARRGVQVRLIVDALGSRSSRRRLLPWLREAGVDVRQFHPVSLFAPRRSWRRDHRKLLIIDGRVAFTGGINFAETYASRRRSRLSPRRAVKRGWRDTHARIEGAAVAAFEAAFLRRWESLGGKPPATGGGAARPHASGRELVAALSSAATDGQPSEIFAALIAAIGLARRRVWLSQAYFAPPEPVLAALCASARAGVDVRLLLPARSDFYPVQFAARAHYGRLLGAGVRVFEYLPAVLHTKTVVIDGVWCSLGSCNLDWRSLHYNDELNAIVVGRPCAATLERVFETDANAAKEILLPDWQRRGLHRRLAEWLAVRLSPLW